MSERGWWLARTPGTITDPVGLDRALAIVGEKLCADETLKGAVRTVLGWLQQEKDEQLLTALRLPAHNPPEWAREENVREAAISQGIEVAGILLTDSTELRMVRDWLSQGSESQTDAE